MSDRSPELPPQARVVVVGGGNIGASVLYHLAREGWTDTILLEKAELTSGATWHAAGLVSRMVGGYNLGSWHDYAIDLYSSIESETGQSTGYHPCGSLRVATSPAHVDWIRHLYDGVIARGHEAHLIGPKEVADLNPLYDVVAADVREALFTPHDGHVDPAGVCNAMAIGARQLGAQVRRRCRVIDITGRHDGTWVVDTEQGSIIAEHVVNAGGYHARRIGAFTGLDLPIVPMMHHYVVTDEVPEFSSMDHEIPVTRDDHFCGYLRREQQSALIGIYDKQDPRSVWVDGCPWDSENELFEPNLDGIAPWLERCFERFPGLADRGIRNIVNGAITYTPDGAMLLGPVAGVRNYWLACGVTVGIAWAPGAGRTLAQWMVHGAAEVSTRLWDPRRFDIWADLDFARARTAEDYTLRQAMPYPQHQRRTKRGIKTSGVHDRTSALGAVFEEAGGWERPRLYAPDFTGTEPFGWRRTAAFDVIQDEARTVSERVGLGDFSAFAKFELNGPGAGAHLERICANRMPQRVGRTVLTTLLNRRGTIEGEATITRTGQDGYWFVTGAPSQRRVWDLLTLGEPDGDASDIDDRFEIADRTDSHGVLTIAGPLTRDVLGACTDADLSDVGFPWLSASTVTIAATPVLAIRMSFTGRLAWELHVAEDGMAAVWDELWRAGRSRGMTAFGSAAMNVLRMEKAYRSAHELSNDVSPLEVDLLRMVKDEPDFIGRQALTDRRTAPGRTRIAYVELHGTEHEPLGGEAVLHNDRVVGTLTSAAHSPTLARTFCFVFVPPALTEPGTELELSLFGELVPMTVLSEPAFDPKNEVLRGAPA